jgi:hypothetical protein
MEWLASPVYYRLTIRGLARVQARGFRQSQRILWASDGPNLLWPWLAEHLA